MDQYAGRFYSIALLLALLVSVQNSSALAAAGGDSTLNGGSSLSSNQADGNSTMYYEDMGGRERKRPLSFMLRLNSEESVIEGSAPSLGIGGGIQYDLGKSYEVGTEFSYKRPFSQFENYAFNGGDDLAFYFSDRELFQTQNKDFGLSYKLSGILPTSQKSTTATMLGGFSEEMTARKNLGKKWDLKYTISLGEFLYQYDSSNAPTSRPQYNSPITYANKLALTYKWTKALKLQAGTGIKSKTDYTGATSSNYNVSSGISYEVTRDFSFDLGIRSTVKDTGSGGGGGASEDDPSRANGDSGNSTEAKSGDNVFDPTGTVFYLGTVLRI